MTGREIDERLSAYFDDELEGEDGLAQALAGDPELAAKLADLQFMRSIVSGALDQQAERVPEARFEQIWDAFDRTLERESRLQEAAEAPPGLWERLLAWARPLRVPLATVAAASVLAVVFAKSIGSPDEGESTDEVASNTPEQVASEQPAEARPEANPSPSAKGPTIAVAPDPAPDPGPNLEALSNPEPGEAEIKRIEFGGRTGTISQIEGNRGTTTVIWVTEDEEPVDTERSL
ncbi:anti-sigma factor family protein [Nannocystaceae bacterium ST9]